MDNARQALARLREGNERFVANQNRAIRSGEQHRAELLDGQSPFAIILGCSDSRAPAELIFDQGLGDLFVIRVAGNVVAPSQIGSVEFAAEVFGTRLVVVMGHSQCGAVQAAISELRQPQGQRSPNLRAIVDRVSPAVAPVLNNSRHGDEAVLMQEAVRANVLASANQLRHGSEILERLTEEDGLQVIGAEYSLKSGVVEFFDDPYGG